MNRIRIRYYLKKALVLLLSLLLLSVAAFYLSRLAPGDPLVSYYGDRTEKMSPEERAQITERLGLNDPIHVQYVRWAGQALQGNFGISFKYKQDVLTVIRGRIGNTLILGGIGFVLTFLLSLLLGVFCAWKEGKLIDKIICQIGTITSCIPEFWLSLVLILLFSVTWRLLPSSGAYTIGKSADLLDRIRHLILPMTVVVFSHLWYYAYLIRNRMIEELRADYVLLARAEGKSGLQILFTHCLRSILPFYFSLMAISVPHILGGTYVVEMVFSYPGIGTLSYESARYHDYNMLMVLCLITGAAVIFFGMLGQMLSERIDPRVRAQQAAEEVDG